MSEFDLTNLRTDVEWAEELPLGHEAEDALEIDPQVWATVRWDHGVVAVAVERIDGEAVRSQILGSTSRLRHTVDHAGEPFEHPPAVSEDADPRDMTVAEIARVSHLEQTPAEEIVENVLGDDE